MAIVNFPISDRWVDLMTQGLLKQRFATPVAAAETLGVPAGTEVEIDLVRQPDGKPEFVLRELVTGGILRDVFRSRVLTVGTIEFELWLNVARLLRPMTRPRPRPGRQRRIRPAFRTCPFCDRPDNPLSLKKREQLTTLHLKHGSWGLWPNAAPPQPDLCGLLVPYDVRTGQVQHLEQELTQPVVADMLGFARHSEELLTLFNSLNGGGGTVPHLHGQVYQINRGLPLDGVGTRRRRPAEPAILSDWPARGFVFPNAPTAEQEIWSLIDRLIEASIPYNLVATRQRAYVFPRDPDHEVAAETGTALAGLELAGIIIVTDPASFRAVTGADITSALRNATLDTDAVLDLLKRVDLIH